MSIQPGDTFMTKGHGPDWDGRPYVAESVATHQVKARGCRLGMSEMIPLHFVRDFCYVVDSGKPDPTEGFFT